MKKSRVKRFGLGLIQHMIAACILVAIAGLLLNSYLEVECDDINILHTWDWVSFSIYPFN